MMKIHTSSTSVADANAVWRSIQHDSIDAKGRSQSRLTVPDLFALSGPEEVLVVEDVREFATGPGCREQANSVASGSVISREPPPDERIVEDSLNFMSR